MALKVYTTVIERILSYLTCFPSTRCSLSASKAQTVTLFYYCRPCCCSSRFHRVSHATITMDMWWPAIHPAIQSLSSPSVAARAGRVWTMAYVPIIILLTSRSGGLVRCERPAPIALFQAINVPNTAITLLVEK